MPEGLSHTDLVVLSPRKLVETLAGKYGISSEDLRLPDTAIVTPVYPLYKRLVRVFKGEPLKAWAWKHPPFSGFNSGGDGIRQGVIVCCPMGAPNVAMSLEELSVFGVRSFFFLGFSGGIGAGGKPGDLVIPPYARVGEGTSRYYGGGPFSFPERQLYETLKRGMVNEGINFVHTFPVYTTDALYQETGGMIRKLLNLGIGGIDMETSAFFSVCKALSVRAVAVLWISDHLTLDRWKPYFYEPSFKRAVSTHLKAFQRWLLTADLK